jgi:threonine dehydrogenase-like Zn-dependent dehydrogenase
VVGAPGALRTAFDALRPGGVLSSVGVHTAATFPWSPVEGYDKNLTYVSGRCPARAYMGKLTPMLAAAKAGPAGERSTWTRVITHRLPLSEGVRAYQLFDEKLDGCIKVVLTCSSKA